MDQSSLKINTSLTGAVSPLRCTQDGPSKQVPRYRPPTILLMSQEENRWTGFKLSAPRLSRRYRGLFCTADLSGVCIANAFGPFPEFILTRHAAMTGFRRPICGSSRALQVHIRDSLPGHAVAELNGLNTQIPRGGSDLGLGADKGQRSRPRKPARRSLNLKVCLPVSNSTGAKGPRALCVNRNLVLPSEADARMQWSAKRGPLLHFFTRSVLILSGAIYY